MAAFGGARSGSFAGSSPYIPAPAPLPTPTPPPAVPLFAAPKRQGSFRSESSDGDLPGSGGGGVVRRGSFGAGGGIRGGMGDGMGDGGGSGVGGGGLQPFPGTAVPSAALPPASSADLASDGSGFWEDASSTNSATLQAAAQFASPAVATAARRYR